MSGTLDVLWLDGSGFEVANFQVGRPQWGWAGAFLREPSEAIIVVPAGLAVNAPSVGERSVAVRRSAGWAKHNQNPRGSPVFNKSRRFLASLASPSGAARIRGTSRSRLFVAENPKSLRRKLCVSRPPMTGPLEDACRRIAHWAELHGISCAHQPLDAGQAGRFDGITIAMNALYAAGERAYYLVHALGSIVLWSVDRAAVQCIFDELAQAKQPLDDRRLERAIDAYRDFETRSSQFAVWLLAECDCGFLIASYSHFMRADLEAMTEFHRTGVAPVWQTFFAQWQREVAIGVRTALPFHPQPVPPFRPMLIEEQKILQQQSREGEE